VDNPRFGRHPKYTGSLRLIEAECRISYGSGKTIFLECMNDLFAEAVPTAFIEQVLEHCAAWPGNTYVFQTKNPARYSAFFPLLPAGSVLGTTIETNREIPGISKAPPVRDRFEAMKRLPQHFVRFVTVEPILAFDLADLADWIEQIHPTFLNIGADSKNHGLPEPTRSDVLALVSEIRKRKIEVREKHNLQRLIA
jgi:protein gp37